MPSTMVSSTVVVENNDVDVPPPPYPANRFGFQFPSIFPWNMAMQAPVPPLPFPVHNPFWPMNMNSMYNPLFMPLPFPPFPVPFPSAPLFNPALPMSMSMPMPWMNNNIVGPENFRGCNSSSNWHGPLNNAWNMLAPTYPMNSNPATATSPGMDSRCEEWVNSSSFENGKSVKPKPKKSKVTKKNSSKIRYFNSPLATVVESVSVSRLKDEENSGAVENAEGQKTENVKKLSRKKRPKETVSPPSKFPTNFFSTEQDGPKDITNTNSKPKPFKCDFCSRCFTLKHVLTNHEMIHTGKRPFECKHCDKKFIRSHHLKAHVRIHTGERPYRCDHCDHGYMQSAGLQRHLAAVHQKGQKFQCDLSKSLLKNSAQRQKPKSKSIYNQKFNMIVQANRLRELAEKKSLDHSPPPSSTSDILVVPTSTSNVSENTRRERKSKNVRHIIRPAEEELSDSDQLTPTATTPGEFSLMQSSNPEDMCTTVVERTDSVLDITSCPLPVPIPSQRDTS